MKPTLVIREVDVESESYKIYRAEPGTKRPAGYIARVVLVPDLTRSEGTFELENITAGTSARGTFAFKTWNRAERIRTLKALVLDAGEEIQVQNPEALPD